MRSRVIDLRSPTRRPWWQCAVDWLLAGTMLVAADVLLVGGMVVIVGGLLWLSAR